MSRRVSIADRADAAGISADKTGSVVEQLLAPADQRIEQIPLDLLHEHPNNPRGPVGDVDELAESIRSNGILEPLIVARAAAWQQVDDGLPFLTVDDYVLIAGHRRKAAAVQAALPTAPCVVRDDLVGAAGEVAMLVENLQREDLSPIQEARGYQRLEEQGKSQRDIAKLVGRNQSHISKRLTLLKLPDRIQARIGVDDETGITVVDAIALAPIADCAPSVIEGVLNRPSYKSMSDAVDEVIKQRERDRELEARKQQLRASGITNIVKFPQYGFYRGDKPPTPLEYLEDDGVDVTEHEHFACHAVAVGWHSYQGIKVVPVCTNPKAHGDSKAAKEADSALKEKERREREQVRREKREAERRAIIAGLANQTSADITSVVFAVVADLLLEQMWGGQDEQLAGMLGVAADEDDDATGALQAYVEAGSPGDVARVVTAAALLQAFEFASPMRASVLQLLEKHGYKLDATERELVKKASAA